jgi:DNA repair protein RadC
MYCGLFLIQEHTTMTRIKERLQMYGASTLSTLELLAYLLGNHSSHQEMLTAVGKLLDTYSLSQLQTTDWADLCSNGGLSKGQAQRLNIICELVRRIASAEPDRRIQILASADAAALLKPMMMHLDHEEFRVLVLDTRNHVVANLLLYTGTVNSSVLRSAEVFRPAIARNCPNIIIAHNHPSGDSAPSPEDEEVTTQLAASGKLLDIEVIDHIIIGNPRFTSLKQRMQW